MDFNSFCIKIQGIIQDKLKDQAEVSLVSIEKNNGVFLKGLSVRTHGSKLSPTIYLERFYDAYMDGTSLSDIVLSIIHTYEQNDRDWINVDYFSDYDKVKDSIVYKLIGTEYNQNLLTQVPHIFWNDCAIIFYHLITQGDFEHASVLIRNEHMDLWSVDIKEIYERACENTPRIMGEHLYSMDSIIKEIISSQCGKEQSENMINLIGFEISAHMYVLTNQRKFYGATAMLYSEKMKELAKQYNSGLYIIPSSIHELILIPEDVEMEPSYMSDMIREVNETEVGLEDRLSNTLYYYDPLHECVIEVPIIDKQMSL